MIDYQLENNLIDDFCFLTILIHFELPIFIYYSFEKLFHYRYDHFALSFLKPNFHEHSVQVN
jgi:hypothetical protein